jgi:NAD+ synthase
MEHKSRDVMDLMKIDCEKTCEKIEAFINEKINEGNYDGVLLGISGGIDSSVALFIAVRAVQDPKKVWGIHLPDRDSMSKFSQYAKKLVESTGINYTVMNISDFLRERDTYKPLIMKAVPYHPFINKLILYSNKLLSPILYGSTPFEVTLKRMNPEKLRFGSVAGIAKCIENGFNSRHILRRKILEDFAEENNLLLIGAANRSESFVGWFVKDGVDDLPLEVLLNLYKNQVKQLAGYLGVPDYILDEAPSPDMFKGIGDEDLIGHKYDQIDRVAFVYENELPVEYLVMSGVSVDEYESIMRIHDLSDWKRGNHHVYPRFDPNIQHDLEQLVQQN